MKSALVANPQTWNRYAYVMNNPLRYTDPFGLWAFEWRDDIEYKKTKKGIKEIHNWKVIAIKEDGDNVETLAEQLGVKTKDLKKVGVDDDNIRLSKVGGTVGRVFGGVETFMNNQDNDPGSVVAGNCAQTAMKLGFSNPPMMIGGLKPEVMDYFITGDNIYNMKAKAESPEEAMVGDIVRYATGNVAQHFATFLYFKNGVPNVFSQSGVGGPFLRGKASEFEGQQRPGVDYGTIRGIGVGESGYYRPQ